MQQQLIFEHAEVVFPGFKLMSAQGMKLELGWRKILDPEVRQLHSQALCPPPFFFLFLPPTPLFLFLFCFVFCTFLLC